MSDDDMGYDDDIGDDETGAVGDVLDLDPDAAEGDDADGVMDLHGRARHLTKADLAGLDTTGQLLKWNNLFLPTEVDLITELDGTNLFFINAESLIADFLVTGAIDWAQEPQFVRLMYAIEHLLDGIRASGGVFRLVFFDCLKKLMKVEMFSEQFWTFRQAFLLHCRASGIEHVVFQSWYQPEFRTHVLNWRPSFFLVSNDLLPVDKEDEDEDDEDEDDEDDEDDDEKTAKKLKAVFLALTLRCMSFRTHVAFLSKLQRRGNRIMAFTLESDCYENSIDVSGKEFFGELLEDSDDEEEGEEEEKEEDEEEDDDGTSFKGMRSFKKRSGPNVPEAALLRSYLVAKFSKELNGMLGDDEDDPGHILMVMFMKGIVLHEVLMRQIPLDKRSFNLPSCEDWDLFNGPMLNALKKFHQCMAKHLTGMVKDEAIPDDLKLHCYDLFDGRLFRQIVHRIFDAGLKNVVKKKNYGKVEADFFGFQPWVMEELNSLWHVANPGKDFFPIKIILTFRDAKTTPPDFEERLAARKKPQLAGIDSEFLNVLWQNQDFSCVKTLPEVKPEELTADLWTEFGWKKEGRIDSVAIEEYMEPSTAEKKMAEKLKKKGKVTAADLDWQRKFTLKNRQLQIRKLWRYASSLTGSDKLHNPIIMKEDTKSSKDGKKEDDADDKKKKGKEKEKEEAPVTVKISAKQQAILDQQAKDKEAADKKADLNTMKLLEPKIDALEKIMDVEVLEKELLDLLVGFDRVTDSFEGFAVISRTFRTKDQQAKAVVKVLKSVRVTLKKMQLDKMPPEVQPKVRHMIRYIYCIVQETFFGFGKNDIDGKGIKLMQELLISIGFPMVADRMFEDWLAVQRAKEEAEAAAAAPAETDAKGKKGKEDPKKKGKEEKKEDEKKSKKGKEEDEKKSKKDKKEKDDKKSSKDEAPASEDLASFRVTKDVEMMWSGVGPDEYAFSLAYNGPYMKRAVGNAPDPKKRVQFKPDQWQKDLLDIVDDNRSALIVAPTASGKTFIGYYVMDKVLREDNEGVAVYVAPSKALVNQVSAEIFARFGSKVYPAHSKSELLGVFLREYNQAGGVNEKGGWRRCQILVTIPHVLEMLLLSPNHQDWVKRLRWVVFDEVHCIGERDAGGVQWEHTMQLIPCPFLALSATVSDPSFFHGWLSKVADQKNLREVELVQHTERWNDLYKYIFVDGKCRPLHPFCCLLEENVKENGFSQDLTLTPMEMVHLFQEVRRQLGSNAAWDALTPKAYYGTLKTGFVTKRAARDYERVLKSTFLELVRDGTLTTAMFDALLVNLQQEVSLDGVEWPTEAIADGASTLDGTGGGDKDFTTLAKMNTYLQAPKLLQLCRELDQAQNLPAIVFNFSREENTKMMVGLVNELQDRQHYKYYGTEEAQKKSKQIMAKRQAEYKQKMEAYEAAQKMKASKTQEGKAMRKQAGEDEGRGAQKIEAVDSSMDITMLEPEPPTDLADEIDMEFTFHSPKALGQRAEDIDDMIKSLKVHPSWIAGLRRGIGMHHEGCGTSYKQAVEVLFRCGFLKIVFATGTLALGINMPCRSTIFCGESLELNGLMFRQMSGRAGRRGFDLLGQVIFFDMAFPKIQRLVASDLSSLTGEFQLSPTSLLRALQEWELIDEAQMLQKATHRDKEEIARCLAPMFSTPFFRSSKVQLDQQVAYFMRFSVELLQQESLLRSDGRTCGLANLVNHLFENEPANFVLARLLSTGVLHEYLTEESYKVEKNIRKTHLTVKLTAILAWFLFPQRLPGGPPKERALRKKFNPSEGCPALPPLPPAILSEVKQYNGLVFRLFQELAWSVANTRKFTATDYTLPFSSYVALKDWDSRGNPFTAEDVPFSEGYVSLLTRFRCRSPFMAIGGRGDEFVTPFDLVRFTRPVVHLDHNALLTVAMPEHGGPDMEPTNSWAYDFMLHGKIKYLLQDNGINATKGWKLVKAFRDSVKMASEAVNAYVPKANKDIVAITLADLADELEKLQNSEGARA